MLHRLAMMPRENAVYFSSYWPTPPAYRPYLADAVGLWSRGVRQLHAWAPHLHRTRALLDTAIDDIGRRRTVAVLGSGPLFDVPIESLARTFEQVLLFDIAHLAPVRKRLKSYGNVTCVWRNLAPDGDGRPLAFLDTVPRLDWVISINLLSQIGRTAPPARNRQAIATHLEGLAALDCPVTLVTDVDYRIFRRDGTLVEEFDLLHGHALPLPEDRWLWEVAPFGEETRDCRRVHTVAAYADWHAARMPDSLRA